ncbi:hypothetical protein F7725_005127, partial [Dissostichus mawsoni]
MEFKLSHHIKPKRQIYFRNLKHIDTDIMTLDLQQIPPSAYFTTVSESVEYYNKTLSTVLDLHAPLKSRTVSFCRSAPWFTSELRSMKAAGRISLSEHQKTYSKSLKKARSQFYSDIISKNPGNSKQLFCTIDHLLKPQTPSHIDTTEEQCNNFVTFFRTKVATIRSLLSTPCAVSVPT